jgi:putative membrane protein
MQNHSAVKLSLAAFAALVLAVPASARAQAAKLDDPTIIAIFDAANTWDMETGAIVEKKGTTKEVRELAAMLVRDHNVVRQQGRDLAAKLHVTPTPPKDFAMAKDHAAAVAKLNAANGKALDRAFLEHEIAYHKAVIDAVNTTLLPALQNPEARALVIKIAPAFKAHQDAAQNLLDKMGK